MLDTDLLVYVPCGNISDALEIQQLARSLCCRSSYHPLGGITCTQYVPITHTVYVKGTQAQVEKFKLELTLQRKHYDPIPQTAS
jgi:hypothetical protein